jgi:hypothetical protein
MACALEEIEKWLIARSYHPDASTVEAAAACIRDLAERIAELEDQPTPAPRLPWTSIGVWSMEQGRDDPVPVLRMRGEDELAVLIERGVGDIEYEVMVRPADGSTLSGQPALEQEVEGDRNDTYTGALSGN